MIRNLDPKQEEIDRLITISADRKKNQFSSKTFLGLNSKIQDLYLKIGEKASNIYDTLAELTISSGSQIVLLSEIIMNLPPEKLEHEIKKETLTIKTIGEEISRLSLQLEERLSDFLTTESSERALRRISKSVESGSSIFKEKMEDDLRKLDRVIFTLLNLSSHARLAEGEHLRNLKGELVSTGILGDEIEECIEKIRSMCRKVAEDQVEVTRAACKLQDLQMECLEEFKKLV